MGTTTSESNFNIIVERNPSEARLSELGIKYWPKWGCPPGKITLKYEATETSYFVKGKVKAFPKVKVKGCICDDDDEKEFVEFGAGDVVIIPKGLTCIWDVSLPVDKHYKFDPPS